jgi:hypothetical protein
MGNWQSIQLSSLVPKAVPQAVSLAASLVDQFLTLYKEALQAAKIYQAALDQGSPDILGSLVQAIADTLEGLLQAGKIHALFVPLPKLYPSGPAATVPPTLDDVAFALGFSFQEAGIVFSSGAQQAYSSLAGGQGGNRAFFNTFVQSLSDVLDVNRPQYLNPGDAVTMTVLLLGAPSFSDLVEAAAAFNRAFRPGNGDLTSRMIPVPQNLHTRVVGLPNAARLGVRLDWDPPRTSFASPYIPGVDIQVLKYAVIRSTSSAAASASNVLDFFSTQDLTIGLASDDKLQSSKVVAIGTGTNASFVDDDPSLSADQPYYYCVAWQVQVSERGNAKTLKWDRVSNVVKAPVRVASPSQQGIPPDWVAYGSMLDLLPDVSVQVGTLIEQIRTIGNRNSGGASSSVKSALDILEQNVDQFAARIDDLNARAKRLDAIFGQPLPGLYTTQISGVGGNAFLIGELAARLGDVSDPHRPPYDDNEYVMGVCLVAGGPRLADIQPVVDFLGSLFRPPDAQSPLLQVLQSLGAVVAQAEQIVFGQDLTPLPRNPDGTVTLPDGTTVDAATIDPTTGLPAAASKPVIAEDGTAVGTLDPKNPDAGNTGVVALDQLC